MKPSHHFNTMPKYPPTRMIAIDVDGTLILHKIHINTALVEFCRQKKSDGFSLMLWSARGREYAETIARQFGLTDLFEVILAKPGYIVDDLGWDWIKYTQVIRSYSQALNTDGDSNHRNT